MQHEEDSQQAVSLLLEAGRSWWLPGRRGCCWPQFSSFCTPHNLGTPL